MSIIDSDTTNDETPDAGGSVDPAERVRRREPSAVLRMSEAEAATILQTLRQHDGHRGKTAAALEIDKATLWRKMKKYGITYP